MHACADLLRGNYNIQVYFSTFLVPDPIHVGEQYPEMLVLDALISIAITSSAPFSYDQRLATSHCIQAFIHNNDMERIGFLDRIIDTFVTGNNSGTQKSYDLLFHIISCSETDPYRVWFSCIILLHLVSFSKECKSRLRGLSLGDLSSGEESVSLLQQINANLSTSLHHSYDARISIGYLMLLTIWLYEDSTSTADFLSESSGFQTLLGHLELPGHTGIYITGLISILIGVCILFNPVSSPIPPYAL